MIKVKLTEEQLKKLQAILLNDGDTELIELFQGGEDGRE